MIDLAYIASPSYSGSTLLTFLLHRHPSIATVGELKWGAIDLATYPCSCGTLLKECTFWRRVQDWIQRQGTPFDLTRPATDFRTREYGITDRIARARVRGALFEHIRGALMKISPACRALWPRIAETNRAVIEAVLRIAGGTQFLDGSKDPVRIRHLHQTGDYRIRVIHLVRDGRAVTFSAMKNQGTTACQAAKEWKRTHQQIEWLRRLIGAEFIIRIRYEDLCSKPDDELKRIWTFLEIPPMPKEGSDQQREHHILGNRMRLNMNGKVTLDEKWKQALEPKSLASFERIAGELNQTYGYPPLN